MRLIKGLLLAGASACLLLKACGPGTPERLPILGRQEVVNGDTVHQRIADFRFLNQDSAWISNESFADKAYVADFFFTSCPSICPIMKKQMLRVYERFKGNPHIALLSHTIDPKRDSVPVLRDYAAKLGVSSEQWHFVTGPRETMYDLAENSYMVSAMEDEHAPGGFAHGGYFVLVDPARHIRGVYDGTSEEAVDQLMRDIPVLLKEIGEE